MHEEGLLIVVSGPSGAGKSTVCKQLTAETEHLALSVSVTTRAPRAGEREGIEYFFKTQQEFDALVEQGALLEHAGIYGNCYGTPRDYVLGQLAQGEDVLLEIEMQGALQVKAAYPKSVLIFVAPPSLEELYNRIAGRGTETPETLNRRFSSARSELELMPKYDYVVINKSVSKAVEDIQAILKAEKCRMQRREAFQRSLLEDHQN